MAKKKDKDFVRNVAQERTYQNQDKAYDEAYFKWRADDKNQYSFNYVQDTREHSYMAGKGFIKHGADAAEQETLHNCLRLLGTVMLVMLVFDVAKYLISVFFNDGRVCNAIYYSERNTLGESPMPVCFITMGVDLMKYLTAIFIYKVRTKLPSVVALPSGKPMGSFGFYATVLMMMISVVCRISSSILSIILGHIHVDSIQVYMFNNAGFPAIVVSLLYNCIVLPVLCELFFRGLVLQSFRQFGDSFAVVVSSLACGLCFYDISYMGYAICCSAVISVFTIRSGSIKTAVLMHTISSSLNYILLLTGILSEPMGDIMTIAVYMLISAASIITYSRLNNLHGWSFNIRQSGSELSFMKKIQLMLSSNTVAMWFISTLIMTVVTLRFL